jgi:hypothetical protein
MKYEVLPENIKRIFPLRDTFIRDDCEIIIDKQESVDIYVFPLTLVRQDGESEDVDCEIEIPSNDDGLFEINGSFKVMVISGEPNLEYNNPGGNLLTNITFYSFEDVVIRKLKEAFDSALKSYYYGGIFDVMNGQQVINTFFSSDDLFRDVSKHKPMEIERFKKSVLLDFREDQDITRIIPIDIDGKLDVISTPQGTDRICRHYGLSRGAEVVDRQIVRTPNKKHYGFSDTFHKNCIFPENGRRHLQISSNIATSEVIIGCTPVIRFASSILFKEAGELGTY